MTAHLGFRRDHGSGPCVLRYETDADARVRAVLVQQGHTDDEVDLALRAYHAVARVRATIGVQPGEPA